MNEKKGFTLIELLVVISIIALLLAILLPSLNMAKEMARTVVCKAHMRSCGTALSTYTTEWDDWLAGPNTSGNYRSFNSDLGSSSTYPVQNSDWVSPTLGRELSFPGDRKKRIEAIFETELRCPSNREKYDDIYTGSGGGMFTTSEARNLTVSSYGALLPFHLYSNRAYPGGDEDRDVWVTDVDIAARAELPTSYKPKLTRIKHPSKKVYVMDGTRYLNRQTEAITFNNFDYQNEGGNFMTCGPASNLYGDPFDLGPSRDKPEITPLARRFSFRHNGKVNVLYFDGRTETLDLEAAVDISKYWPSGSLAAGAGYTYDPDDFNGMSID